MDVSGYAVHRSLESGAGLRFDLQDAPCGRERRRRALVSLTGADEPLSERVHRGMDVERAIEELYRADWGRILATLIRLVGDFEIAEEATQEGFAAAIEQWKSDIPQNPRAWLIQTARHKAIDRIRRKARLQEKLGELGAELDENTQGLLESGGESALPDDRLRLIFTCCHPALAMDAQVALTLSHVVRTDHRRDRARVSGPGPDDGAALGARKTQDSRGGHTLRDPARSRTTRAVGCCDVGDLPGVQ